MPGITVDIKGNTSDLEKSLGKASGGVLNFGGILGGISPVAIGAAAGIGVAVGGVIKLTEAAAKDRDEQNKLLTTIKASGAAHGNYQKILDDTIAAGQDLAFTDSETRAGMAPLIVATKDVGKASKLMAVAQDVARFSGVDLETASKAVAKAQSGQDAALRKLIPGLKKGTNATETIANASRVAAGQANAYAKSSAGMGARASDAFSEIGETIGSAFLPLMDEVLPALLPVIKQFAKLISQILPPLISLIKILASALGIVAGALSRVVSWISSLISWLSTAIRKIGDFLDKINPLKGLKLPSLPFLNSASAPAGAGVNATASTRAASSAGGNVVINIHGATDAEATARTIQRVLSQHQIRVGRASSLAGGAAI